MVAMASQRHKAQAKPLDTMEAVRRKIGIVEKGESSKSREEEFLAAALGLFAERNFASVTIKDIADALGVNTALIYYYFDSKTDLFRATIAYAVENAFANMRVLEETQADPASLLAAWLENHVERFGEIHRFVKIALDYRGAHDGDPAIEAIIAGFYAKERQLLSGLIKDGVDQGIFDPVDPVLMSQFISTYLDGCMVRSVILPDFDLRLAVGDLHRKVLQILGAQNVRKPRRRR